MQKTRNMLRLAQKNANKSLLNHVVIVSKAALTIAVDAKTVQLKIYMTN